MKHFSKFIACASPVLLAVIAGCASGLYTADPSAAAPDQNKVRSPRPRFPSVLSIQIPTYHAYGASIVAGSTLSDPATQAYPALVSKAEHVSLSNYGVPGSQACDIAPKQIFAQSDSPALASHPVYTLHVGTNDVDIKDTGAYESIYMLCHQAAIAWLALPLEYKVLADGSGVKMTGPGNLDTSDSWKAWTTGGQGASVSFTVKTTRIDPIYSWPVMDDNSTATYTYSLDGVVIGSARVQSTPRIATQLGTTRSLGFIRIPNVSAGSHVVTFTQTSAGTNGVSVVGIASPVGPDATEFPRVLVGNLTYQLHGGTGGACTVSDDPCLQYNNDIAADVNLFATDGLNVRLFDTRKYMMGTPSEMSDALHPNALGHQELAHSVEDVW